MITSAAAQAEFDGLKESLKLVHNLSRQAKRKTLRETKRAIWKKHKISLK